MGAAFVYAATVLISFHVWRNLSPQPDQTPHAAIEHGFHVRARRNDQRTGTAAQASSGGAAAGPQAGAQHPAGQDVSTECSVLDTPPDFPAADA
ncbi:hypothetical protein [Burkholderia stabilis]|uniref:hypothetical protein n=1 Tax=Burkholderia stabilis TaxID=95485 RepID=UPI0012EA1CD4|nr:hypothetical protein [Burkholderia stabilis]HDR9495269.1 hypothetical protein [Burkholderia stabilis]HDR9527173.1 hypothetical protein [Burkholderia stabilis]HDR9533055.1 hypothetical protein [Burkholderia stabilis]HDR9541957.1 hypothetical protein [Burkholderia stabilis]HDR9549047.1 hypothetical protein [Burkholderia stabilis]